MKEDVILLGYIVLDSFPSLLHIKSDGKVIMLASILMFLHAARQMF